MTEDHDWLEQAMASDDPYIQDASFSERVMANLPPPRRRRSLRAPILLGSSLLACLLALVVLPGGEILVQAAAGLVGLVVAPTITSALVGVAVLGMLAWGVVALATSEA